LRISSARARNKKEANLEFKALYKQINVRMTIFD